MGKGNPVIGGDIKQKPLDALKNDEDIIDTAMNVIEEYVDEVLHRLSDREIRNEFLIKIEEYCANHPESL